MIKNKSSDGFGVIGVLVIVIAVGVIGFAGWTVYKTQSKTSTNTQNSTESTKDTQSKTVTLAKTYADKVGNFSVKYPESWILKSSSDTSDPNTVSSTATLTSPSGTVLNLASDMGGRGGACLPEESEKPFTPGNTCPSIEYLSLEVVPITNVYYYFTSTQANGTSKNVYDKSTIVLTTTHFMDEKGKQQYVVGLTDSNPPYELKLNSPKMGLITPDLFFEVYDSSNKFHPMIYAYASGSDASFLQSEDVSTIKEILRTMTVSVQ